MQSDLQSPPLNVPELAEQLDVPIGYAEGRPGLQKLRYFLDRPTKPRARATLSDGEAVNLAIARFERHPAFVVATVCGIRHTAASALDDLRARGPASSFLAAELRTADLVLRSVQLCPNPTPFDPAPPALPPAPAAPRARVLDLQAHYGDLIEPSKWRRSQLFPSPPPSPLRVTQVVRPQQHDLERALRDGPYDLITGLGHGEPDRFYGALQANLLNTETTPDLRGAVVHLLSCHTARALGPHLRQTANASAVFGYATEFRYILASSEHFWRADASIPRALAAGHPFEAVMRLAEAAFLREAQALCALDKYCCAAQLLENFLALRCLA